MQQDIIIVGGSFSGLLIALEVAQNNNHLQITLIEKQNIIKRDKPRDGRAFAISKKSLEIFQKIGIWESVTKFAGDIKEIIITENGSKSYLNFQNQILEEELGFVIENYHIHKALRDKLLQQNNVQILSPETYQEIYFDEDYCFVKLVSNKLLKCKLLIAADGKNSYIRNKFNIKTFTKSYMQTAILLNIRHQKKHYNIAYEQFSTEGPLAILPMKDENQSSIVWIVKSHVAESLLKLDTEKLIYLLKKSLPCGFGKIEALTDIVTYNLDLTLNKNYFHNRVVFIGDSSHAIHPIAGQGFNLTMGDIMFLSNLIQNYNDCGLDIGSSLMLKKFQKNRKLHINKMVLMTDGLNKLFLMQNPIVKMARRAGLSIVEKSSRIKDFFMRSAGGL